MKRPDNRWRERKEKTTDYNVRLDVRQLVRNGDFTYGSMVPVWSESMGQGARFIVFANFREGADWVTLLADYRQGFGLGGWSGEEVIVHLTYTPCHYGGRRIWFVCPGCEQRAAILHFAGHGWQCRKCLNLAYPTQCESPSRRRRRRMAAIEGQLTYVRNKRNIPGNRPKGMHRRTFERLLSKWDRDNQALEKERMAEAARFLARFGVF